MTEPRKKLSDILRQTGEREQLSKLWKATAAAEERGPLPPGEYTFRILSGDLFTSRGGTPGYKLTLEVTEGEHEGRRAWHDLWLTPAALPMTKRDLAKIGMKGDDLEELLQRPIPAGILIRGKLAIRRDDDGNESNRLVRFECIGIEPGDAFEPKDDADHAGAEPFPFGANAPTGEGAVPPSTNGEPSPSTNGTPPKPKRTRKRKDADNPTGAEGGTAP
jgi:hypothetical protein